MIAAAPLAPGVIVHVRDGSGAGRKIIPGRIATHHVLQGVHHVTVRTANGVKSHKVVPAHPKETKLRMHPARSSNRPKVSAYVDHQAIESWWAGSRGRFNGPLPAARVQSRGGSISKPRVRKDTMTVTEDLGHDGQSPVTIMQGGSRLERCPECGAKLSMDGQCPVHGNVLKGAPRTPPNLNKENTSTTKRCGTCEMFNRGKCWGYGNYPVKKPWVCDSWEADKVTKSFDLLELLLKEDGPVPSTGEALPGNTIMDPRGRSKLKNPDPNEPVPNYCNICGGTDGFHTPECPHYLANNGGGAGPAGLGA